MREGEREEKEGGRKEGRERKEGRKEKKGGKKGRREREEKRKNGAREEGKEGRKGRREGREGEEENERREGGIVCVNVAVFSKCRTWSTCMQLKMFWANLDPISPCLIPQRK